MMAFLRCQGLFPLLGLLSLLLNCSCTPVANQAVSPPPQESGFTLLLQPLPQVAQTVSFAIESMLARRSDGSDIPLPLLRKTFSLNRATGWQHRLVQTQLPPGEYSGISLRIASAELHGEEGAIKLHTPDDPIQLVYTFMIRPEESATLMLSLSGDDIVTNGAFFSPKISVWKPQRILDNLKGFVGSSLTENITLFNKHTGQLVRTYWVGRSSDLALDQLRRRLYVAMAVDNAIKVIDTSLGTLIGRIRLRFNDRPISLALDSAGTKLLVLNAGSNTLSIVDAQGLFETRRINLTAEPNALFTSEDGRSAYVTYPATGSLSAIDPVSGQTRRTVQLQFEPLDGKADPFGHSVYVIGRFSTDVLVLDAISLQPKGKIFIGGGATAITVDPVSGLLYIGKTSGDIVVVDPRSLIAIDEYQLSPGQVEKITIEREENALFVLQPSNQMLTKVDLVSKQELARMELEAGSHSVVVMGER